MAAIFPIPYDIETRGPARSPRRPLGTVIPFDRRPDHRSDHRRPGTIRLHPALGIAVIAIVAIGIVTMLGLVFSAIDGASQPPAPVPVSIPASIAPVNPANVIVVQSGDTLTSIARRLQPTGDVSGLVDRLAAIHGPAVLQPGERIRIGSLGVPGSGAHR